MTSPPKSSGSFRTSDVLVVGAGVIGLSIAWELSKRGHQVSVVEGGPIAGITEQQVRSASWAGAGILPAAVAPGTTADPFEQLKTLSMALHPAWAKQLLEETGIDNQFSRCGGLHLATTPAEAATLVANQFWWDEHNIEYHTWKTSQLEQSLPALEKQEIRAAWFLPGECQLRNPRHLKALAAACQANGVKLFPNTKVIGLFSDSQDAIEGVHTEDRDFRASRVCICSGAWARQILDTAQIESGLLPVRGQIVLYRLAEQLFDFVINEGHRYLVPRQDGLVLAGSVEEEVGYKLETTDEATFQIRTWAEKLLPELSRAPVERTWAGLRPGSFDSFPYMGRVPGHAGLYVAAGHFRSGLYLSPGTAVCIADLIEGRRPEIDMQPFRIGRG